ncbi:unnamed protein product [Rhizophagus irregularis]|nr:unnamed protein product [Rhizophagus irregularis]
MLYSSTPGVYCTFSTYDFYLRQIIFFLSLNGAHAICQIPLNIKEIEPDFFATNCHNGFVSEFSWIGTQDLVHFWAIHAGFEISQKNCEKKIQNYAKNWLLKEKFISSILGTENNGPRKYYSKYGQY